MFFERPAVNETRTHGLEVADADRAREREHPVLIGTEVVFVGKDALPVRIGIEWKRKSETHGLDAGKPAEALDELAVKRLSL